jgi:hypothetical protein
MNKLSGACHFTRYSIFKWSKLGKLKQINMPRQIKYFLFRSVAFAMLITVLIQGACQKEDDYYISRKDFANTLKGEWYVGGFGSLSFWADSIEYYDTSYAQYLRCSIYDSIVCTLDGIENIQYWTITGSNDDLYLETEDLCGGSDSFVINYQNQQSYQQVLAHNIYFLVANITLVSQDSCIY